MGPYKSDKARASSHYPRRVRELTEALVKAIDGAATAKLQNELLMDGLKKMKSKKAKQLLRYVRGTKSWKAGK